MDPDEVPALQIPDPTLDSIMSDLQSVLQDVPDAAQWARDFYTTFVIYADLYGLEVPWNDPWDDLSERTRLLFTVCIGNTIEHARNRA